MPITHIVRSFDAGGSLRCTPHTSLAEAQKEQRHRISEAFHRRVIILPVEEIKIPLDKVGGPVTAWREVTTRQPKQQPDVIRRQQRRHHVDEELVAL
jgi:hypothetical protein